MNNLSTCPKCLRMVTLPEGGDGAATVRCPLCQAEYRLSEALAMAPPALIVVSTSKGVAPLAASSTPVSGLVTEPFFVQGKTITPPSEDSAGLPRGGSPAPSPDDFILDFEESLAETDVPIEEDSETINDFETSLQTDTSDESPPTGEVRQVFSPNRNPQSQKTKPLVKPLQARRKRKKKGPIFLLVEWIFGGGVAVLISYYALMWIRGDALGLPRFEWLPFLPEEKIVARETHKPVTPPVDSKVSPIVSEPSLDQPKPEAEKNPLEQTNPDTKNENPTSDTPPSETAGPVRNQQIGPRTPPKFATLDLDTATQDVIDAIASSGNDIVNAESYPAFCRLAEVRTYVPQYQILPAQKKSVQQTLGNLAENPKLVAEIGRLAAETVKKAGDSEKKAGGNAGGILLAGKVKKTSSKNGLFAAGIELPGGGKPIAVFSDQSLTFQENDEVLLLGAMVANPAENMAGYSGKNPLVIWLGAAVIVPAESKAAK